MEGNRSLGNLTRVHRRILADSLTKLFQQSLEGLLQIKATIEDLQRKHAWYHSNLYQIQKLRNEITTIQQECDQKIQLSLNGIGRNKEELSKILLGALRELGTSLDENTVEEQLKELIRSIEKIITKTSSVILLSAILGGNLLLLIGTIFAAFAGASSVGVATAGLGAVVGGVVSEIVFRTKLKNLIEALQCDIARAESQQNEHLQLMNSCFDRFEQSLRSKTKSNTQTNLVWCDERIHDAHNQNFVARLERDFLSPQCNICQFYSNLTATDFIHSDADHNIILIASGTTGKSLIADIGHYWNIKGIIIYDAQAEHYRSLSNTYKKIVLITRNADEVLQKIHDLESGDIHLIDDGCLYQDVKRKLNNADAYLSTTEQRLMISNLSTISTDIYYHRNIMDKVRDSILSRNLYPRGIPNCFDLPNLYKFTDQFVQALVHNEPVNRILTLYTAEALYFYKIINTILKRLDEELILLMGDYIKALRYALLVYHDRTNRIPGNGRTNVYRGIKLAKEKDFQEFQRKFRVNDTMILPAFSSASLSRQKAEGLTDHHGVLFDISIDCTQRNKPKNISAHSRYPGEDEVLLSCFSALLIQKITQVTATLYLYECTLVSK